MREPPRHSRRSFLRGFFTGFGVVPRALRETRRAEACRPPGALWPPVRFLDACSGPTTGCRACVDICPEHCIIPAQPDTPGHPPPMGAPFLLPARVACTLCGLCQPVCPTGALVPVDPREAKIGEAVVDLQECRTLRPPGCSVCVEACPLPDLAIHMDGDDPRVAADVCTGCGLCAVVCPASAISIRPPVPAKGAGKG